MKANRIPNPWYSCLIACLCGIGIVSAQEPESTEEKVSKTVEKAQELRTSRKPEEAKSVLTSLPELSQAIEQPETEGEALKNESLYEAAKLLGSLELQLGNPEQSLEIYQAAFEAKEKHNLEDNEIYNRLGWSLYKNGDLTNAIKYFEQAKKVPSGKIDEATRKKAYNNLGIVYFEKGDLAKAESAFKESIEKFGPDNSTAAKVFLDKIEETQKIERSRSQKIQEQISREKSPAAN